MLVAREFSNVLIAFEFSILLFYLPSERKKFEIEWEIFARDRVLFEVQDREKFELERVLEAVIYKFLVILEFICLIFSRE